MPIISVTIAEGRSIEQKRSLVRGITSAVTEALGSRPEQVRVMISELPLNHYAVAGVTFAEQAEANGESA